MQLEALVNQYRDLLLEALRQHAGLDTERAESVLSEFLSQQATSPELIQALSAPDGMPHTLVEAVRNFASRYEQSKQVATGAKQSFEPHEQDSESPRFSAAGLSDAEFVWALSLVAPALSVATHTASRQDHWKLFEQYRLRPMVTGLARPDLESMCSEASIGSTDDALQAIESERLRWQACIDMQIRHSIPKDVAPEQADSWFVERSQQLFDIVQRIVGVAFAESVDQLRCVQQLSQKQATEDPTSSSGHFLSGLRMWEAYLHERIEKWDQPRFVYDVGAVFLRNDEPIANRATTQGSQSETTSQEAGAIPESLDELIAELQRVLNMPLPCENDLFLSDYFADPNSRHPQGMTIGEVLSDTYPPEQALRLLKDVSKQQGNDPSQPWHLAVSKLIYFGAIAAYITRVDNNPTQVTSLSFQDLASAFRWAETLPQLDPLLKQLFADAWQTIGGHYE